MYELKTILFIVTITMFLASCSSSENIIIKDEEKTPSLSRFSLYPDEFIGNEVFFSGYLEYKEERLVLKRRKTVPRGIKNPEIIVMDAKFITLLQDGNGSEYPCVNQEVHLAGKIGIFPNTIIGMTEVFIVRTYSNGDILSGTPNNCYTIYDGFN